MLSEMCAMQARALLQLLLQLQRADWKVHKQKASMNEAAVEKTAQPATNCQGLMSIAAAFNSGNPPF
jgi:hypothetical protein